MAKSYAAMAKALAQKRMEMPADDSVLSESDNEHHNILGSNVYTPVKLQTKGGADQHGHHGHDAHANNEKSSPSKNHGPLTASTRRAINSIVVLTKKRASENWRLLAALLLLCLLLLICACKIAYHQGPGAGEDHVMMLTKLERKEQIVGNKETAQEEEFRSVEDAGRFERTGGAVAKKKTSQQMPMQQEAPEIPAPPPPQETHEENRLQAAAHTPSTKQRVVEVQPVEDDLAKPKPPNAEKTAPGPPGTPVSAWPRAPPRFTSTPEQRRGQPLNANDDALEFTCGGQEVRGIKDGDPYWVYMLPFEDSPRGRQAFSECWDIFWQKTAPLTWGHFEKVYDVTTESHTDPDAFPAAHKWRPARAGGPQEKEELKRHLEEAFFGSAVTLYSFMVHVPTRTSVWTGVWQHPYGASSREQLFHSGYFWEVQVAKESRGHGACASAVANLFDHAQRLYNSPNSGSKYLPRLWPGVWDAYEGGATAGEGHFLKKIMIADASWESITFDFDSPKQRATPGELERFRWFKHGERAQAPGVLMQTLKRYTEQAPAGVYLVDNYEPVDEWFKQTYYGSAARVQNHPQPIDAHFGNTYGCKCYRAPWQEAEKTGVRFQEPAIVLSGWGPQNVYFNQGATEETVQDWRYTYIYDVAAYGEVLHNARIPALPRGEWIADDESVLQERQANAQRLLEAEKQEGSSSFAERRRAVNAMGGDLGGEGGGEVALVERTKGALETKREGTGVGTGGVGGEKSSENPVPAQLRVGNSEEERAASSAGKSEHMTAHASPPEETLTTYVA